MTPQDRSSADPVNSRLLAIDPSAQTRMATKVRDIDGYLKRPIARAEVCGDVEL
jgi:hypothetical protein